MSPACATTATRSSVPGSSMKCSSRRTTSGSKRAVKPSGQTIDSLVPSSAVNQTPSLSAGSPVRTPATPFSTPNASHATATPFSSHRTGKVRIATGATDALAETVGKDGTTGDGVVAAGTSDGGAAGALPEQAARSELRSTSRTARYPVPHPGLARRNLSTLVPPCRRSPSDDSGCPITRLDAPRVQVFLGQAASMMARGRTTPFRRARRMACSDGGQARLRPGVSGRGPAAEPMKPVPGSGRRADRLQLAPSLFTDRPLGPFRPASGPAFRDSRHRSLLSRPSVGIGRRPSRPCLTAPRVVTFDPASASRRPTD